MNTKMKMVSAFQAMPGQRSINTKMEMVSAFQAMTEQGEAPYIANKKACRKKRNQAHTIKSKTREKTVIKKRKGEIDLEVYITTVYMEYNYTVQQLCYVLLLSEC